MQNGTPLPSGVQAGGASPIADLSYRNYDGPLHTRAVRWWIVALANIRLLLKKPSFWIVTALIVLPYLGLALQFYFTRPMMSGGMPGSDGTPKPTFATGFENQYGSSPLPLMLLILALIVGAGSIAADNRANALMVYLSKPITKGDYLLGKWMGIFIPIFAVAVIPPLGVYIFCFISYAGDGFFKNEPTLLVSIVGAALVPAVLHASLLVGFSAWSKSPRMAGAIYAGFYFVSVVVFEIVASLVRKQSGPTENIVLRFLSPDGLIRGMAWNIYRVTHSTYRPDADGNYQKIAVHAPNLLPLLAMAGALVFLGVAAARMKVRAVEVVRG